MNNNRLFAEPCKCCVYTNRLRYHTRCTVPFDVSEIIQARAGWYIFGLYYRT